MVVRKEDDVAKIHLSEISSIMLQTMQVYISAYLMGELAKSKISLVYSDEKHNPIGQALPLYGAHNVSKRIQEQLGWGEPIKKRVWQRVVREKIRQQAAVLADRDLPEARVLKAVIDESNQVIPPIEKHMRQGFTSRLCSAKGFPAISIAR